MIEFRGLARYEVGVKGARIVRCDLLATLPDEASAGEIDQKIRSLKLPPYPRAKSYDLIIQSSQHPALRDHKSPTGAYIYRGERATHVQNGLNLTKFQK